MELNCDWTDDFDKEEKVTTIALDEYLEGKLDWKKTEESIDQES